MKIRHFFVLKASDENVKKMIRLLLLLFAAGLLSGCCLIPRNASNNTLHQSRYEPSVLEFSMGGGGRYDPRFKISYRSGEILYYKYSLLDLGRRGGFKNIDPIVITPTDKQWREFSDKIYSIKAYDWKKKYEPPYTVYDGTYWSIVVIFYGESKLTDVVSFGNNAFPPEGFKELMEALDGLTGTTDLFYDYTSNPDGNDYIPRPEYHDDEDTPVFRPESE